MSGVKEPSGISNPFARNVNTGVKKPTVAVQKTDTARENVKKQLQEALDSANENIENSKFTNESLVSDIENCIFELTGKNSKDKAYREKAKKILARLKGNRNVIVRSVLKKGIISASDFCKLNDKQLDDDSYFEKFGGNGENIVNSSNPVKPKMGTKPPAFKNIPIQAIDLTHSDPTDAVNEYFDEIQSSKQNTENEKITDSSHVGQEGQVTYLNNPLVDNHLAESNLIENNFEDSSSNKVNLTQIETNSVQTDAFSVREEPKQVQPQTEKLQLSPKMNNGRTIGFNPPSRNTQKPLMINQTFDVGINSNKPKENIISNFSEKPTDMNLQNNNSFITESRNESKINSIPQSQSSTGASKPSDKLKELKELMEKKKMGKNLNMPLNKTTNYSQPKSGAQTQPAILVEKPIYAQDPQNTNNPDITEKSFGNDNTLIIPSSIQTEHVLNNNHSDIPINKPQNSEIENIEALEVPHNTPIVNQLINQDNSQLTPIIEKKNPFDYPEHIEPKPVTSTSNVNVNIPLSQNKIFKPPIISKPAQPKMPVKLVPPSGGVNIFGNISHNQVNVTSNSNEIFDREKITDESIKDTKDLKDLNDQKEEKNVSTIAKELSNQINTNSHSRLPSDHTSKLREKEIILKNDLNCKPHKNISPINDEEIIGSYREREEINVVTPSNNIHTIKKDLKPLIINNFAKDLDDNSVKLNSSMANSPKLDNRSYYTYTNTKNYTNTSILSMRDKYKNFNETKVCLETQLELANKKCEVYEKELLSLRKTVNDLKLQLSRANEESYKLEIARLKQSLLSRESEMLNLTKENSTLKGQVKKYEQNIEGILDENKKFRAETEKRFAQLNKEIENLNSKKCEHSSNNYNIMSYHKEDHGLNMNFNKEDEINIFTSNSGHLPGNINMHNMGNYSANINNYRRDGKKKGNSDRGNISANMGEKNSNENASSLNHNDININNEINNTNNLHHQLINTGNDVNLYNEINYTVNDYLNNEYLNSNNYNNNEYDHGNFTNGNPNIIEEVGSDNYLNMNGNTYDEMKDLKEDDNLQDHQYFDNIHTAPINVNTLTENLNKKPNTGDSYHQVNVLGLNSKGESGATHNVNCTTSQVHSHTHVNNNLNLNAQNIFSTGNVEEDKNYESENLFETLVKTNQTQNPKIYDNYGMNNLIKNKNKEKEISNVGNISKNVQSGTGNKSILTQHQHQPPKKNIFDDNAFDIFDKSDNAENIFETFSKPKNKDSNSTNNLFDF